MVYLYFIINDLQVMPNRKILTVIISLFYAASFILYATVADVDGSDIAIYAALAYAIILPVTSKWNSCNLAALTSNNLNNEK